jgi:hypothetical protein
MKSILHSLTGLLLSAAGANATIDSFTVANGTTVPNTPPTLDSTYGTADVALNLGNSSGGTLVYDGITFTNNSVTSATNTVTWATVGGISVGATTDAGAIWSLAINIVPGSNGPGDIYKNTYGTEAWSNKSGGGVFHTLNITGLDAGRSYQIQLMHGEDRSIGNGFDYIGTLVATDSALNTANTNLRFGDENDASTYVFAVVTLEVSGVTGVDIYYPDRAQAPASPLASRDPSLAGIVIQSKPAVPATDPRITSITSVGVDLWELTLKGVANTAYEFRSDATLGFMPGSLIATLAPGVPAVGTISGSTDSVTTDGSGNATVRMTLTGLKNFVRAQTP